MQKIMIIMLESVYNARITTKNMFQLRSFKGSYDFSQTDGSG